MHRRLQGLEGKKETNRTSKTKTPHFHHLSPLRWGIKINFCFTHFLHLEHRESNQEALLKCVSPQAEKKGWTQLLQIHIARKEEEREQSPVPRLLVSTAAGELHGWYLWGGCIYNRRLAILFQRMKWNTFVLLLQWTHVRDTEHSIAANSFL